VHGPLVVGHEQIATIKRQTGCRGKSRAQIIAPPCPISKQATRPWKATAQTCEPSTTGGEQYRPRDPVRSPPWAEQPPPPRLARRSADQRNQLATRKTDKQIRSAKTGGTVHYAGRAAASHADRPTCGRHPRQSSRKTRLSPLFTATPSVANAGGASTSLETRACQRACHLRPKSQHFALGGTDDDQTRCSHPHPPTAAGRP
jgi:hypothetical protein